MTAKFHKNDVALLIAIGNVCRQWSYLEVLLAAILWWARGLTRDAGIEQTASLEITSLLAAVAACDRVNQDSNLSAEVGRLQSVLRNLRLRRNRIVHGVYRLNVSRDVMYVEHHRERRPMEPIEPNEIRTLAAEISRCANDLRAAMDGAGIPRT